jgi:hypothetical protein
LAKEMRLGAVDFVFAAKSFPSKVSHYFFKFLVTLKSLLARTANVRPQPLYA